MAKQNAVSLYGRVVRDPSIHIDNATGKLIRGACALNVIRSIRSYDNKGSQVKYDCPIIISGDPDQIQKMREWRIGDMVELKGFITTSNVIKSYTCEHCRKKVQKDAVAVFISPMYSKICERDVSEKEAAELLKNSCEASNVVYVIGNLCNDPELYHTRQGVLLATYQIAINRKYRIVGGATDARTDYPWIKSYGVTANSDGKYLRKGSSVYVDGALQTRKIEKKMVCPHCGEEFSVSDSSMEIVPYAVEYLRNYRTAEEVEEIEAKEFKENIKEIFNEGSLILEDHSKDDQTSGG